MNINSKQFVAPVVNHVDTSSHPLRRLAPDTWKNIPQCLTQSTKWIIEDCYRTYENMVNITKSINDFKESIDK